MNRRNIASRRPLEWGLLLALALLGAGCSATSDQHADPTMDPVTLQGALIQFASAFEAGTTFGIEQLGRGPHALDPKEVLRWKLAFVTSLCSIASGPNTSADLLDMAAFVTLTREALEKHWQPERFGEFAQPWLDITRSAEGKIWQLVGSILAPEQETDLRRAIEQWQRGNPVPKNIMELRGPDFELQAQGAGQKGGSTFGSMFNVLRFDPLSGLDSATREVAKSRLLAERALYVVQVAPTLLRWQMELMALNVTELPAVSQLVATSSQMATAANRFACVAEQLPVEVRTEREALVNALQVQEKDIASLLTSGTRLSDSLNTTITSFEGLVRLFEAGDSGKSGHPVPNSEPFRIQDYTKSAAQLEDTARQLTELIRTLNLTIESPDLARLSAELGPAVREAEAGGKGVVNHAFWKAILLVAAVLVAALIYRFLGKRVAG